jgi:homoserine kinase
MAAALQQRHCSSSGSGVGRPRRAATSTFSSSSHGCWFRGNQCVQINRSNVKACAATVVAGGKVYIDPVKDECAAFAPATVANLGPGFDWLGCAVEVCCCVVLCV